KADDAEGGAALGSLIEDGRAQGGVPASAQGGGDEQSRRRRPMSPGPRKPASREGLQQEQNKMVQLTLPKNSKVTKGKTYEAPEGATNIGTFHIYRWSPEDDG